MGREEFEGHGVWLMDGLAMMMMMQQS